MFLSHPNPRWLSTSLSSGLFFIESNIAAAIDEKQHSPIGFDIIFPAMIKKAKHLDLNMPLEATNLEAFISKGSWSFKGHGGDSEGRRTYLAYISEALEESQLWEMVMKHQRKNGSLFNSPATTATAFTHLKDSSYLKYLCSLLNKFGDAAKKARLKRAEEEAEKDKAECRAQMEQEFQRKLEESSGDSGANVKRLERETDAKIQHLKIEAARISHDVVNMLLKHVTTVKN